MLELYLRSLAEYKWAHVLGRVTTAQHETVFHHAVKPPAKPAVLQRLLQFGFEANLNMRSILKQRNTEEPPKRAVTRVVFCLGGGGGTGLALCPQDETCLDLAEAEAKKKKTQDAEVRVRHLHNAWQMIEARSRPTRDIGTKGQKRSRKGEDHRPRKGAAAAVRLSARS